MHESTIIKEVGRQRPILIAVISFTAGAAIGYFLGKKFGVPQYEVHEVHEVPKVKKSMDIEADEIVEIDEEFEELRRRAIESEGDDPDARMYIEQTRQEKTIVMADQTDLTQRLTIYSHYDDGTEDIWSYEEEEKHRSEERPYALSRAEFFDEEKGYTQLTLTYWAGDNKMSDDKDELVHNYLMVTGPLLFGHGSEDPNVYYVRNDRLRGEYEVLNDPGKYEVEIQGLQEENEATDRFIKEVRHKRANQKFRPEEDED